MKKEVRFRLMEIIINESKASSGNGDKKKLKRREFISFCLTAITTVIGTLFKTITGK